MNLFSEYLRVLFASSTLLAATNIRTAKGGVSAKNNQTEVIPEAKTKPAAKCQSAGYMNPILVTSMNTKNPVITIIMLCFTPPTTESEPICPAIRPEKNPWTIIIVKNRAL